MSKHAPHQINGRFDHLVYSPRGEIEGVVMDVDGSPAQFVFDKHDSASAEPFMRLKKGQQVTAEAMPQPPSDKGKGAHPVFDFKALVAVDGKAPAAAAPADDEGYRGKVARFNYARHGEINGVVLDSGDFLHLRPDGYRESEIEIGDEVWASGDAQQLATGKGWAVEVAEYQVTKG